MVSLYLHYGDLKGRGATIRVMNNGEEIPLSVVRSFEMEVPSNGDLDMSGILYLSIGYLLWGTHGGLEV